MSTTTATKTLRIRDHAMLQGAVARAVVAGVLVALSSYLIGGRWTDPLVVAMDALALGVALVMPWRWRSLALAAAIAAAVAGATRIGATAGAAGQTFWMITALGLLSLTYVRDLRGPLTRRAIAWLAGGAALVAGAAVADELRAAEIFSALPGALERVVLGATAGLFAGLGVLGRELEWVKVESKPGRALVPASPAVEGELGALLDRASAAFHDARGALGSDTGEVGAAAADLMGKVERFALRWHELGRELGATDRAALATRLESVRARESGAADDVVREEYASARGALEKQVEYLDSIERGRDRAVARLHHQVAVLERLRMAALHHRAAAAGRVGEELSPLVDELVAAGRDLDCEAEALAELPALH